MKPLVDAKLYGLDSASGGELLPEVSAAFERLRRAAAQQGIDLAVASGCRNFERQLSIWNRKASGQLPVLDEAGCPLDLSALPDQEKVFAILRWSALPGASRHHWGTDCDVYDRAALPPGYQVQLTRAEADGLFANLHRWLDQRIAAGEAEGFFRPYDQDRGGIAPEPWHLSYEPLSRRCQQDFCIEQLGRILSDADIVLKDAILANLPEVAQRFIRLPTSKIA